MPEQTDHDMLITMVQKLTDLSTSVAEMRKVVMEILMPAIADISRQEVKCITGVQGQLDNAGKVFVDIGAKIEHALERIKAVEAAQVEADKTAAKIRQDFDHAMSNLKLGWGILTLAMIPVVTAAGKALLGL